MTALPHGADRPCDLVRGVNFQHFCDLAGTIDVRGKAALWPGADLLVMKRIRACSSNSTQMVP